MSVNGTLLCLDNQSANSVEPALPVVQRGQSVDIGPIEVIAPGQGRAFVVAGRVIAVFRQRDGRVFATDNQCPHRGGPLADGIVGDGKVICPLHNWKIDLASGHCAGEAARLRTYDVTVVAGRIVLAPGMWSAECGLTD
jgi:nitrite reductase (NADH) small subunit